MYDGRLGFMYPCWRGGDVMYPCWSAFIYVGHIGQRACLLICKRSCRPLTRESDRGEKQLTTQTMMLSVQRYSVHSTCPCTRCCPHTGLPLHQSKVQAVLLAAAPGGGMPAAVGAHAQQLLLGAGAAGGAGGVSSSSAAAGEEPGGSFTELCGALHLTQLIQSIMV